MLPSAHSFPYCAALLLSWAGLQVTLMGQVPTKCFEIESILVDACNPIDQCPGSTEGQNEMFRFRTGPDPVALADLSIQWPNNPWRGFEQSTLTAQLAATLNGTIEGCGWLLEPPGGVVPPGSPVIVVTSTAMCTAGNSFAALGDTVFIAFQEAGNSNGHFANHNNGVDIVPNPVGGVSLRTLIMTHVPTQCGDTATYDRQLLVNIYGTYGGFAPDNDGATALFSWPGIPVVSYVNNGCFAPYDPVLVSIISAPAAICDGEVIGLEGAASAGSTAVYWQGGTGTFSDPASAITTYQPGPGDAGTVELSFCALDACGNTNCASIELPIASNPDVVVQGNTQPCLGSTTLLTATGADTYIWSNGQTGPFNAVGSNGTYTVTGSTACGTAEATITVAFVTQPEATITGTPYLCPTATLVASGGQTYLWSTGDTSATIVVSEPGGYSVAVSNACGSAEASVDVLDSPITAGMMASPVEGPAPLLVNFTNFSLPQESEFLWDFGDGNVSSATSPVHLFTDPGVYEVVLTATLGDCPASNSLFITVLGNDPQEVVIRVPNVFSPNGDGVNDVLEVISTGIVQLDMYILNRWGQLVKRLQGVQQVWDGRTVAGQVVPEGTYYYELRARGVNGVDYELRGTITVLR